CVRRHAPANHLSRSARVVRWRNRCARRPSAGLFACAGTHSGAQIRLRHAFATGAQTMSASLFDLPPEAWSAIALSLRIAFVATLCATPFAIFAAYLLARTHFIGKSLLDALVHLPLVLPP